MFAMSSGSNVLRPRVSSAVAENGQVPVVGHGSAARERVGDLAVGRQAPGLGRIPAVVEVEHDRLVERPSVGAALEPRNGVDAVGVHVLDCEGRRVVARRRSRASVPLHRRVSVKRS